MKHKKSFSGFQKFLLFSFSFHIFLSATIVLVPYLKKEKIEQIEIVLLEPTPVPEVALAKKMTEQKQPLQVVQMDENQSNNEIDPKAKYLSAKNNTVKKETVAKNIGQFKNAVAQKPAAKQNEEKEVEKQISQNKPESKSKLFNTGFDAYASLSKNDTVKKMAQKEHSFQNGSSAQQASSTNDHLENTEPSLMTQLNTREYKYYGYHKRIRTQLDQWYESKLRDQMKKILSQGRTIASEDNKRTQLLIILNPQGNLVRIQVMGASGVRELDDAAVEAFKKAAPFPNPPKGMIDPDGTIKVRWDFVLS
jgi:TonB family protein